MQAKEIIKQTLNSSQDILGMLLTDLTDLELMVRPVPAANHIAWQLGHLVCAEIQILEKELPRAVYPQLPADFVSSHQENMAKSDNPAEYRSKSEYQELLQKVRQATLANLDQMTETELDQPTTGPLSQHAPTLAALLVLTSNHTLMHAGQFSVVRRKLGKKVAV